jgi:iron complex outermembrane receptor protein
MSNRKIARAVRLTLVAASALSAGLYGSVGSAQQLEEIVVTGSRIAQANVEGTSPVTVVTSADVRVQGVVDSVDIVNNLPSVFATQGNNISNGATGTSTVSLRGLGSSRTLVLVNGRRLPAGDPYNLAADLNQIPAPLIERVEVLTGGASAIYGSDAVSGVVNFIMKSNFEGVQIDLNHNFYNHTNNNAVADVVAARGFDLPKKNIAADGHATELSLTLGSNFADGKGNAVVFFGYQDTHALLQAKRDYSACALSSSASGFGCGGSSTSYPGRFYDLNSDPLTSWTVADSSGNVRPFASTDIFNYNPYNYFQRPNDRYEAAVYAHYDFNDSAQLYTEFNFHDDHTVAQIAPSGLFGLLADVSCSNPLLSQAWIDTLCTPYDLGPTDSASLLILRRNVEGGGRQDDLRHTSYRGVVGLKGSVFDHWDYDLSAQYGTVLLEDTYYNDFSYTRAGRAMDVVADPETGAPVCASVLNGVDPNCVPYNIWSLGGVTPEALAYLQTPGFARGNTQQTVVSGSMSSDLGAYGIKMPTAEDGISVAFGAEHREESMVLTTDTAYSTGDLFGQGGPNIGTRGAYNVNDLFAEVRAPLVQGMTGIQSLVLDASYRYSDYSTGVSTDTYGFGLDYAPVESFKLRGSYQRAVRAPNINELFAAAGLGLYDNDYDPCAGAVPVATLAQCQNTGVTAAQYGVIPDNPAGQYNAIFGGNVDLKPETSDSYTMGFVFTPTFVDRLSVTADYFNIKVDGVVSSLNPVTTLTNCLEAGLNCDLIHRDSIGTLWATSDAYIISTNINLSKLKTEGFDLTANYGFDVGSMGQMNLNLIGTYLAKLETEEIPGLGAYDCAGYYGSTCGTPNPEWRHTFRATWMTPWNVDLTLSWRHFDSVAIDRSSSQPLLEGSYNAVDAKLAAQDYFDLVGSYTFREKYELTVGINNLLDDDPPLSSQVGAGFGNGNTYPQVYDALGRYIFLHLSAKF